MQPPADEVWHFSEDPGITRFEPHVAATARQPDAYVWAVDAKHAPTYWFPRQCPRMLAWTEPTTTDEDRALLAPSTKVHAIEYGWLDAMRTVQLYAYRFAAKDFRPFEDHAYVAEKPVVPLGPPHAIGDLFARHDEAGIELRIMRDLWPFVDAVTVGTLGFSGIRLRNARPRRGQAEHPPTPAEH
jgi:hypothetical protein